MRVQNGGKAASLTETKFHAMRFMRRNHSAVLRHGRKENEVDIKVTNLPEIPPALEELISQEAENCLEDDLAEVREAGRFDFADTLGIPASVTVYEVLGEQGTVVHAMAGGFLGETCYGIFGEAFESPELAAKAFLYSEVNHQLAEIIGDRLKLSEKMRKSLRWF